MAPIVAISPGRPITLTEDLTYALPSVQCDGFASVTNSGLQVNMTNSTNGWLTLTVSADGQFFTSAPFIRSTSAAVTLLLKASR